MVLPVEDKDDAGRMANTGVGKQGARLLDGGWDSGGRYWNAMMMAPVILT